MALFLVLLLLSCLETGRTETERYLLTVSPSPARSDDEASRTWIATLLDDSASFRILTEDFWTARDPSPSFDGRRFLFVGRGEDSEPVRIWEMTVDGADPRPITAGHGDPSGPAYLPDGRVLYSDRVPGSAGEESRIRALFSCAPDGTDIRRLTFGTHQDMRPRVLDDGRILFERVFYSPSAPPRSAALTIRPDGTGVAPISSADSPWEWIEEAPPDFSPSPSYSLVAFTRVKVRPRPPIVTSVVNEKWPTGTLLCLDVYNSRLPSMASLAPGSVDRVRVEVVSGLPDSGASAPGAVRAAEASVEPDGSFFIEVPADLPLALTLLGKDGAVLASLDSGIWVRPSENRGCIGCHEEPDLAPENRQPLAVRRAAVSLVKALERPGGGDAR